MPVSLIKLVVTRKKINRINTISISGAMFSSTALFLCFLLAETFNMD
jgi:hypothetical protein